MPQAPAISEDLVHAVRRNDHNKSFKLGNRTFELKDLSYDDYVQFVKHSGPLVESVVSVIQPVLKNDKDGQLVTDFELSVKGLDMDGLAELAGHNLPLLAQLACKQSDPSITIEQVKDLAMHRDNESRGPMALIEVVLKQVAHNKIVEEIAAAFPRLGSLVADLAPSLAAVAAAAQTSSNDTTPTTSSTA